MGCWVVGYIELGATAAFVVGTWGRGGPGSKLARLGADAVATVCGFATSGTVGFGGGANMFANERAVCGGTD